MAIPVPLFQPHEILLANEAALLQWNGYDYVSGNQVTSDYEFLRIFSNELRKALPPSSQQPNFASQDIDELINVCRLKMVKLRFRELDFALMEAFLLQNYPAYLNNIRGVVPAGKALSEATLLLLDTSMAVVKPRQFKSPGHRVGLASRLMFFAAPECLIFNYSWPIATKGLQHTSIPRVAYPLYAAAMLEGLRLNWTELSKYNIPFGHNGKRLSDLKSLEDKTHTTDLYDTHWWARRVIDIALLIRFGKFKMTAHMVSIKQLCRHTIQVPVPVQCP